MIDSKKKYQEGREVIFIVSIIMAILGFIGNMIENRYEHSLTLNVIYSVSIFILVFITVLFFFNIRTNTLYIIAGSTVISSLLIAQTLISSNPNFEYIVEKHILSNTLFILMLIIISGFVIGLKLSFAQFLLLIGYLIFRPFQVELPFLYENVLLIIIMLSGVFIAISVLIFNLERFIIKINEQSVILDRKNGEILDNIKYAERIQKTILPEINILENNFRDYFIFVKPKDIVSSNFYFVEYLDDTIYFSVINCRGESVSGSLLTMIVNYGLNVALNDLQLRAPNEIIKQTKDFIFSKIKGLQNLNEGMDLVLCSLKNNKLTYSGNNDYLWVLRNNEIKEYGNCTNKDNNYTNKELTLIKDDIVFLFSGGITKQMKSSDSFDEDIEYFKTKLLSIRSENMNVQKVIIEDFWEKSYSKQKQLDDICLLAIKI